MIFSIWYFWLQALEGIKIKRWSKKSSPKYYVSYWFYHRKQMINIISQYLIHFLSCIFFLASSITLIFLSTLIPILSALFHSSILAIPVHCSIYAPLLSILICWLLCELSIKLFLWLMWGWVGAVGFFRVFCGLLLGLWHFLVIFIFA